MAAESSDKAEVIALPPLIYGAGLLLGFAIQFVFPVSALPPELAFRLGVVVVLASAWIVVSALRALARAKTSFDLRQPTTAVVTDGAFRFSRNPMYVALTLLYLGVGLLVNSLWVLLLVMPVMVVIQRGVVEREERYLERKFGEEYLRYRAHVRRWI